MDRTYAAELNEHNEVVRAIVGSAEWASETLGGVWIDSEEKVGAGWEMHGERLRPVAPFPSWLWDGESWCAPVAAPEDAECVWDEDNMVWVVVG